VILSVSYDRVWRYGETLDEMADVIDEVMANLEFEHWVDGQYFTGETAWFCFADRRQSDEDLAADSYLRVAVNRSTGYGALVWFVAASGPRKGGIFDQVWISDNPEPPGFDPRVVSDPDLPLFFDPRSTLPVAQVRAAVEQFCRSGTGERPESAAWVPGQVNGHRLDQAPLKKILDEVDPFG
jgi:hypothetical protein